MPRWSYDLSRIVPYDFPTPSDEYDDTLVYVQQKFNSGTLDVVDVIDNHGAKKWHAKEGEQEINEDKKMRRSRKYGIT